MLGLRIIYIAYSTSPIIHSSRKTDPSFYFGRTPMF
jgi:hypothetical protein